jgi:hypothetical protein
MDYRKEILNHYKKVWEFSDYYFINLEEGPMKIFDPDFTIIVIPPNKKRDVWTYATLGMSDSKNEPYVELHLFSEDENDDLSEILTATAYYHTTEHKVMLNDTINFGRPWQPKSKCEYGLISLPYLDGPVLEKLIIDNVTISCYWLIPITEKEKNFKKNYGIEKLEEKFEYKQFNYLDPYRDSVI